MKPQTRNSQGSGTDDADVSSTRLFGAFAAKRRQYALSYLAGKPAAIHLGDLAEYIAITEATPTYDRYQRILVDLHHRHLPHLRDADLVRYDEGTERLELAVDRELLAPYLELAELAR